jgi:hypothetical protein
MREHIQRRNSVIGGGGWFLLGALTFYFYN